MLNDKKRIILMLIICFSLFASFTSAKENIELEEGKNYNFSINGEIYRISPTFIDKPFVQLEINEKVTPIMRNKEKYSFNFNKEEIVVEGFFSKEDKEFVKISIANKNYFHKLNQGESFTFKTNASIYNISAVYISQNDVKFSINGRYSPLLSVGEKYHESILKNTILELIVENIPANNKTEDIVFFSLYEKKENYAPQHSLPTRLQQKKCHDSDKGINYFESGVVNFSSINSASNEKDYCFNTNNPIEKGDTLREYYCEQLESKFIDYKCPLGCLNGKCLVNDSHLGIVGKIRNIFTQKNFLNEIKESDDEFYCYDSDYGKDYYKKGIVFFNSTNMVSNPKDSCVSAIIDKEIKKNVLREYFCNSKNRVEYVHYLCKDGCNDGVCIKKDIKIFDWFKNLFRKEEKTMNRNDTPRAVS